MTSHINLDAVRLDHGNHDTPDEGACLLEVVSMFAHEPFSDRPACVSPVLAAFGRSWNDALDDDRRQELRRYVPLLIGTAGDREADERRAWMAADWLVRVHTPAWLRLAGLVEQAERLEALPELTDEAQIPSVMAALDVARTDTPGDAARPPAIPVNAVASAAGPAAGPAAAAACWDVVGYDAVNVIVNAVLTPARDAAGYVLQPTVDMLIESAHDLYARMIAAGNKATA